MRNILSRGAILLALMGSGGAQVFTPVDSQWVRGDVVHVVVRAREADVEPGDRVLRRFKKGRYVHLRVRVKRGINPLRILYLTPDGEKVVEERHVIAFPTLHNRWGGKRVTPHDGDRLGHACRGCHKFRLDRPETCRDCHEIAGWEDAEVVHPPVEDEDCESCHGEPAITREVCEGCHDFEDVDIPHAPFGVSDCGMCHDPHVAQRENLLLSPVHILCAQCHDPEGYQEGVHPVARHPIQSQKLTCVSCHNPHGAMYPFFLVEDPATICTACHEDK